MRGQSKVVPLEKLHFSKLSHCFPIDSALCSLAEPQTQERALSGSNYCTTQPKWQMNKCHNTTACSLPLCANSLTHTHTHTRKHMHAHPLKPPKTPLSLSPSCDHTNSHKVLLQEVNRTDQAKWLRQVYTYIFGETNKDTPRKEWRGVERAR